MNDPSSQPKRWLRLRSEPHSTTRIFDVSRTIYRHPDRDKDQDFFVINAPDWVNVIALTPDHQLVLVKQFRYGIDNFSVEIRGGVIESAEKIAVAMRAVRELREETGYVGESACTAASVAFIPIPRCKIIAMPLPGAWWRTRVAGSGIWSGMTTRNLRSC